VSVRLRLLLAPAYGVLMATAFLITWLALDRAVTRATLVGAAHIAAAAVLAAAVAQTAGRLLHRRPWGARFAAALLLTMAGTPAIIAVLIGVPTALEAHPIAGLSPKDAFYVMANFTVSALYSFLTIPARLLVPLGLPLTVACAALIVRDTVASVRGSAMRPDVQEPA